MPSERSTADGSSEAVRHLAAVDASVVHDYGARGVSALRLCGGTGPFTATLLYVEADGALDAHVAGRDQVLYVLDGDGWLEIDGARHHLMVGDAGHVRAGERHAKGSAAGMVALVVQSPTIDEVRAART